MTAFTLPATALDGKSRDDQTQLLLDMAKVEGATLALLGAQPSDSPVYVLDNGVDLAVGAQWDCLRASVGQSGLEVSEPEPVSDLSELLDGLGQWVVRLASQGADAGVLAQGETKEAAHDNALRALCDLSGASVLALGEWAQRQAAFVDLLGVMETSKPKAKRASTHVITRQIRLHPLPMSDYVREQKGRSEPQKVLRKQIPQLISAPGGLHTAPGTEIAMTLQAIDDGGLCYANHHDLLSAVRLGLDITALRPWPDDAAHRYLLLRQLKVTMKQRGFLELIDFDPAQVWTLDRPQMMVNASNHETEAMDEEAPQASPKLRSMTLEEVRALKPDWPPQPDERRRVVMLLDCARLAMEQEPEWELSRCAQRQVLAFADRLWVSLNETAPPRQEQRRRKKTEASEPA